MSVSTKVGTPVSLTGQRFTVQIPSSQTTVKAGKVPTVKQTLPSGKWLLFVLVLAEYLREGKLGFSVGKSFFKLFIFFFFFTATPTTPTVQNVLINPSLIGPKNILITTNMVSSQNTASETNTLKRKHEDDDDYDNL